MSSTLNRLYNAIWYPALPFALLAGGGDRRERLGRVSASEIPADGEPRLWFHAASVGEIEALSAVARALIGELPGAFVTISAMTQAGREAARRRIPGAAAYRLAPLDCAYAVRSFVGATRPDLLVIAETELWPNYFVESRRAGARVAIVNGRISERAFRRYRLVRPLFANALGKVDLFLAQTETDARRYRMLGAPRRRVVVTGNTKFDLAFSAPPSLRPELERALPMPDLLVAGSTAPGEERIVLDAYRTLAPRFPNLGLVLAPRHLSLVPEVLRMLREAGCSYALASDLGGASAAAERILLVDTMGDLRALYYRGAVAFVGGSLKPGRGGQSLAEPAAAGVPVLFGPFHENQRQIAEALTISGGGRVVRDSSELAGATGELLAGERERTQAGMSARRSLELLAGAVATSLPLLRALIDS